MSSIQSSSSSTRPSNTDLKTGTSQPPPAYASVAERIKKLKMSAGQTSQPGQPDQSGRAPISRSYSAKQIGRGGKPPIRPQPRRPRAVTTIPSKPDRPSTSSKSRRNTVGKEGDKAVVSSKQPQLFPTMPKPKRPARNRDTGPSGNDSFDGLSLEELCAKFCEDRKQAKRTTPIRQKIVGQLLEKTRQVKERLSVGSSSSTEEKGFLPKKQRVVRKSRLERSSVQSLPPLKGEHATSDLIETLLDIAGKNINQLRFSQAQSSIEGAKKEAGQLPLWQQQLKAYCKIASVERQFDPDKARKTLESAKNLLENLEPQKQIIALCKLAREEATFIPEVAGKTLQTSLALVPRIPMKKTSECLQPVDQVLAYCTYLFDSEIDSCFSSGGPMDSLEQDCRKASYQTRWIARQMLEDCRNQAATLKRQGDQRKAYLKIALTEAKFDPQKAKETLKKYLQLVEASKDKRGSQDHLELMLLVVIYCRIADTELPQFAPQTLATCEEVVRRLRPSEQAVAFCKMALVEAKFDPKSAEKRLKDYQKIAAKLPKSERTSQKQPIYLIIVYGLIAIQGTPETVRENLRKCEEIAKALLPKERVVAYSKIALLLSTVDPEAAKKMLQDREEILSNHIQSKEKFYVQRGSLQYIDSILTYCRIASQVGESDPTSAYDALLKARQLTDDLSPEQRKVMLFEIEVVERALNQRLWDQINSYCKIAISQARFDKDLAIETLKQCESIFGPLSTKDRMAAYFKISSAAMEFDLNFSKEILKKCKDIAEEFLLARRASIYYDIATMSAAVDLEFTKEMLTKCKILARQLDSWERGILMRQVVKFEAQYSLDIALKTLEEEEAEFKKEKTLRYDNDVTGLKRGLELVERFQFVPKSANDLATNVEGMHEVLGENRVLLEESSSAVKEACGELFKSKKSLLEALAAYIKDAEHLETQLRRGVRTKEAMLGNQKGLSRYHAQFALDQIKRIRAEINRRQKAEPSPVSSREKLIQEQKTTKLLQKVSSRLNSLKETARECMNLSQKVEAFLEIIEIEEPLNLAAARQTLEEVRNIAYNIPDSAERSLRLADITKMEKKLFRSSVSPELLIVQQQIKTLQETALKPQDEHRHWSAAKRLSRMWNR